MTRFIIAGTFSLISFIANAQTTEFAANNSHKQSVAKILGRQQSRHEERPTAIKKRIIAYSKYQKDVLTDSISNFYSGTRGSLFNSAVENAIAAFPFYTPGVFERQIVQCDSFQFWNIEEGETEIGYRMGVAYEYNEQQQPTKITMAGGFQTYDLSYNTDDLLSGWELSTMGMPTTVTYRVYNDDNTIQYDSTTDATSDVPSSIRRYSYNAAGLVLTDSLFEWQGDNWALASTTANAYDGDSRISESIFSETEMAGETLAAKSKETYSYEGDNPIAAENITYFWNGSSWIAEEKHSITFNSAGNPETNTRFELLDGAEELSPIEKIVTDYNDEGLIIEANTFAFTDGAFEEESSVTEHMYYETYDDGSTTSTENIKLDASLVLVYPVPATNQATIAVKQAIIERVTITDASGKIVMQMQCKQNSIVVPTSTMSAGIYFAQVTTDKGVAVQRLLVNN